MAVETVPIPTDLYDRPQWFMRRIHFAFETGFYNILKLLEKPPRDDLNNFLGYCEAWVSGLTHHHDTEESVLLPYLQRRLDFSEELEQHENIHHALDAFLGQIALAKNDPASFDPSRMIQILKDAEDNLMTHLKNQIDNLASEHLKVFTVEEIDEMMTTTEKYAMKHDNPVMGLPFLRTHTPPEYKTFPPLPWVIKKLVLPLLAMRHSGYWTYSPYSVN